MKILLLVTTFLAVLAPAQMEKRLRGLYDREAFRRRAPVPGRMLPELVLRDLEGKRVSLSSLRGRPLVLLGGAYT